MSAAAFCTACGEPLSADARFCRNCGTPVDVAAPVPVGPPPGPKAGKAATKGVATPRRGPSNQRLLLVIGVVAAVVIVGALALRKDDAPPNQLTAAGLGPLRIGMSVDEAVNTGWVREDESTREVCGYASVTGNASEAEVDPDDVGLIFIGEELALISVGGDSVTGPGGLAVGDTEDEVRDVLGDDGDEEVDEYGATHLDLVEGGRGVSFVFYDGSQVDALRAGTSDGLGLIEGCA